MSILPIHPEGLCPQNWVCSWQQLIQMNRPGIPSICAHTDTSKNDDFLILEDIPKYTAHICAHLSHPRWGFGLGRCKSLWTQPWLDDIYKSPGFSPAVQEAEWLLDGNFRSNDEVHLGKSQRKTAWKTRNHWKKEKYRTMENKDNMLRYECGWATSTVINFKNLFAMCFMTFRIWSCCWKFLSQTEASSTAKSLEAVF